MTTTTHRHPPTKRIAVAELMRESDLTAEAIAAKTGVPYATVCRWNQFHNWRPWFRRTPPAVDPRRWQKPRLAALERVYRLPSVDPGDLAQAVGTDRARQKAFFRECGFAERIEPPPGESHDGPKNLRASLRSHVARQIADLDAELSLRRASPAESARMLRDLTMLKKLVDEIEPAAEPRADDPSGGEDLAELRARILARVIAYAPDFAEHAMEEDVVAGADAGFEERTARSDAPAARIAAAGAHPASQALRDGAETER